MMAEPLAAALHGVAKHYHGFTLGPLNLEIPAGSIVGLIGENGAGKTTLLKLLTGVNRPDAGTVELLSATPDDAAVRAKIGVVFEDAYFYESLTPAQVGASLRGIFGPAWDAGFFAALLEQFHLPPEWIAATCRTAAGCESLVHPRVSVLRTLPGVVCDAASIDDIMRLTSKEG